MFLVLLVLAVAVAIIGQRGIQRNSNYENKWGLMFFGGSIATVVILIVNILLMLF